MKDIFDVKISRQALKDLKRVPLYIAIKLQAWIDNVGHHGLSEIRKIPSFHDEPLNLLEFRRLINMTIDSKITKTALKEIEKITGGPLTLGKLILAIRQSEKMSQVDFAEKLKISKQQLCDIEHGRKSISPKLAAEYAVKLGYSEKQFIRLALQEELDRAGLLFHVDIKKAA